MSLVHADRYGGPLPAYEGPLFKQGCDRADLARAAQAYSAQFPEIDPRDVGEGDVVLLRTGRHPFHCGLIVVPGHMLHIENTAMGSCVEPYDGLIWKRRIVSFHRFERTP